MKTMAAIILFCVAGCQSTQPSRFIISYKHKDINYTAAYDTNTNAVALEIENNQSRR